MDIERVLRSKEYREGWEVYEYHRLHGNYPDSAAGGVNPYGAASSSGSSSGMIETRSDCWLAGAHSAYGTSVWRGIPRRTPPKTGLAPKQLRLFEVDG